MKQLLEIYKALSDENRLRALAALDGNELCMCQLTDLLELAPSTVSKHMSILIRAELVQNRKEGRWVYYSLTSHKNNALVGKYLKPVLSDLRKSKKLKPDVRRLKEILKINPQELCKSTKS